MCTNNYFIKEHLSTLLLPTQLRLSGRTFAFVARTFAVLFILFLFLTPSSVQAAANSVIGFQSKIVNKTTGLNVVTGTPACVAGGADTCDFRASIYTDPAAGTLLWQESHADVEIGATGGYFNLQLNSVCGSWTAPGGSCSGAGIVWGSDSTVYIEIEMDTDGDGDFATGGADTVETFTRKLFTSVPYAYYADSAGSVNGLADTDFVKFAPASGQTTASTNSLINLTTTGNTSNPLFFLNESGAGNPNLLQVQVGGSTRFLLSNGGMLQLSVSGTGGGLQLGGDAHLYRSAADILRTPDSFIADLGLSAGTTTATAFGNFAASTTSKASLRLESSAGTDPSAPNSGDLWWNGTNLYFNDGTINVDLLAGGGGATKTIQTRTVLCEVTLASPGIFDTTTDCGGLDNTYDHLQIKMKIKSNAALGGTDYAYLYYNNDLSDANYTYRGSGGTSTSPFIGSFPDGNVVSDSHGVITVDILNYRDSYYKTSTSEWGYFLGTSAQGNNTTTWINTSAITQLTIRSLNYLTTPFVAGSYFEVVGIKEEAVSIGGGGGGGCASCVEFSLGTTQTSTDTDALIDIATTGSVTNPLIRVNENGAGTPNLLDLQVAGTSTLVHTNAGQLQLSVVGSNGGILIGGDAQLYRSAANTFRTPDSFIADLGLSAGTTTATAFGNFAASTTSKASLRLESSAGTDPSAPNSGDLWWNGTNLNFRAGATTVDLLGSAAATKTIQTSTVICEITLGATGSFDTTTDCGGLPSTYDHLKIRYRLRSSAATTADTMQVLFNNDTTLGNYVSDFVYSFGSTVVPVFSSTPGFAYTPDTSNPTDSFATGEIDIPSYRDAKLKMANGMWSYKYDATRGVTGQSSLTWNSTSAVTRITLRADGSPTDGFISGSTIELIGIKEEAVGGVGGGCASCVEFSSGTTQTSTDTDGLIDIATTGNVTAALIKVNENGAGTPNLVDLQVAGTSTLVLNNAGQLQLPSQAGGGVLLGGDVLLQWEAANRLKIPDTVSAGDGTNWAYELQGDSKGFSFWGRPATSTQVMGGNVAGDVNWRFLITADGRNLWGDGTAAGDTNLFRDSANVLRTEDLFTADGGVAIGTTTSTAFGTVAAATTGKASLRLLSSSGTDVSSPNSGDLWWNGTNLNFRTGSSTVDLLGAGGGLNVTTKSMQTRTTLCEKTFGSTGTFDTTTDCGGLASGYDHLEVNAKVRTSAGGVGFEDTFLYFNNDTTGTNYEYQLTNALGAGVTAAGAMGNNIGRVPDVGAMANAFGTMKINIIGASDAQYKTVTSAWSASINSSADLTGFNGLTWRNTAAITRLAFLPASSAGFVSGSYVEVVGVKEETVVTNVTGGSNGAFALTTSTTDTGLDMIYTGSGTTADAISITNTSSGAITDAIDVSDAEIVNAINIGENNIVQTDGGTVNWNDSAGNNLIRITDIATNFGASVEAGAMVSLNSYFGEEFMRDRGAVTADAAFSYGDFQQWTVDEEAAGTNDCQWDIVTDSINGIMRMETTTVATSTACLIYPGTSPGNPHTNQIVSHLPLVIMKVMPSHVGANDKIWAGLSTTVLDDGNDPNNGIWFTNVSGSTWTGITSSGGVQTTVTCTGQTISTTQFALLKIETRSSTDVRFYVDNDVSNGVNWVHCGTSTTNIPSGAMAQLIKLNSTTVGHYIDVDYYRNWQDDAAPRPASELGPITDSEDEAIVDDEEAETPVEGEEGVVDDSETVIEGEVVEDEPVAPEPPPLVYQEGMTVIVADESTEEIRFSSMRTVTLGDALIHGKLEIAGDIFANGSIRLAGSLFMSAEATGRELILPDEPEFTMVYAEPRESIANLIISLEDSSFNYRVLENTELGFKVEVIFPESEEELNVYMSWITVHTIATAEPEVLVVE